MASFAGSMLHEEGGERTEGDFDGEDGASCGTNSNDEARFSRSRDVGQPDCSSNSRGQLVWDTSSERLDVCIAQQGAPRQRFVFRFLSEEDGVHDRGAAGVERVLDLSGAFGVRRTFSDS